MVSKGKGLSRVWWVAWWVLAFAPLITACAALPFTSELIPAHFGIDGQIDRWGSRWELLVLPVVVRPWLHGLRPLASASALWQSRVRLGGTHRVARVSALAARHGSVLLHPRPHGSHVRSRAGIWPSGGSPRLSIRLF